MEKPNKININNADIRALKEGVMKQGEKVKLYELKAGDEFILKGRYGKIIAAARPYVSWYDFALTEHSTSNTEQVAYKLYWNEGGLK